MSTIRIGIPAWVDGAVEIETAGETEARQVFDYLSSFSVPCELVLTTESIEQNAALQQQLELS